MNWLYIIDWLAHKVEVIYRYLHMGISETVAAHADELRLYYDNTIGTFALKGPLLQVPAAIGVGTIASALDYMFHDAEAIVVMLGLFVADWITALVAHSKQRTLRSAKVSIVALRMCMALLLMSVAWWFGQNNPAVNGLLAFAGMSISGIFYFIITSQLILSIAENMALIGVLPLDFVNLLKEKLSWKRIFKKKDDE